MNKRIDVELFKYESYTKIFTRFKQCLGFILHCIKFIEYPYGNHIWIHAYNYFYKITFPFLKDVRKILQDKKTTLLKLLCKQEDIPTELEIIIIKFCF